MATSPCTGFRVSGSPGRNHAQVISRNFSATTSRGPEMSDKPGNNDGQRTSAQGQKRDFFSDSERRVVDNLLHDEESSCLPYAGEGDELGSMDVVEVRHVADANL
jgi:hypothetical protein